MNRHDQRRRNALVKTLRRAKEQAETAMLYLSVDDRNTNAMEINGLAMEHIEIALEHLTGPACRVCGCTEYAPCSDGCWWVESDLCSSCAEGDRTNTLGFALLPGGFEHG